MFSKIKEIGKREIITTLLVVCLFFIWPYIISVISSNLISSDNSKLIFSFVANFILVILLVAIYFDSLKKDFRKLKDKFKKSILIGIKYTAFGLIIMFIINLIIYIIFPNNISSNDIVLNNIFEKTPILFILNTLFYYPIVEELVFKKAFRNYFNNKWTFVIITGFLNAFFNVVFSGNDILGYIYIFPYMALYFSWAMCYFESDNIIVSIMMRMLYNVIPTLLFLFRL